MAGPRVRKERDLEWSLELQDIEALWAVHLISVHLGLLNLVVSLNLSPFIGNYFIKLLFLFICNTPVL